MILSIWLTHPLLLDGHHGEGLGRGQKGKEDSELHGDYYFGVGKVADGFFFELCAHSQNKQIPPIKPCQYDRIIE